MRFFLFRRFACDLGFAAYEIFCPKGPCGTTFFLPQNTILSAEETLRDDFPAQNTILSAQKALAGRLPNPKYNFVCPKGPLRYAFLAQNTILSAQKPPAGRFFRRLHYFFVIWPAVMLVLLPRGPMNYFLTWALTGQRFIFV